MCGRYKIEERWLEYSKLAQFDWNDPPYPLNNPCKVSSDEIFPRNRMPIVRFNEAGKLIAELRQWGFIMLINGKTLDADGKPKKVRRDDFNAMSEKLTSSLSGKWAFKERRCLIPMSKRWSF